MKIKWWEFDGCHCKVAVNDLSNGEIIFGTAGFSPSGKTCYVWYDDHCGEAREACLDFHHDGEKEIDIGRAICDWGLPRLQNEVKKCTIMCANCHRKYHRSVDRR